MPVVKLYEDEILLAVEKPRDIHVHPSSLSRRETSLQDILQEELGFRPLPIHRLDRPVGGVLLLAKDRETASVFGERLRERGGMEKRYLAIVRGWMEGGGIIDRPLRQAPGKPERESRTRWRSLALGEAPWGDGQFPTSRYSLLELEITTGRYHQIRRHLASVSHPVIGDIPHGDNPKNKIWKKNTAIDGVMLRSRQLSFIHPKTGHRITVESPPDPRFTEAALLFGWDLVSVGEY